MSERYSICKSCLGTAVNCGSCDETGFSGNATDQNSGYALKFRKRPNSEQKEKEKAALALAIKAASSSLQPTHIQKVVFMNQTPVVLNQNTLEVEAQRFGFTVSQYELIRNVIAKNAEPDELELFLQRCKMLQLNPLMPGQIYFLKFWNKREEKWSPGTIVVGIDGFRTKAARTGKLSGIRRGVVRNEQGKCIGAWADIFRSDWQHPAHEEVSLAEYFSPFKETWKTMPETMIKKVAEAAALRMAFAEELGGVYVNEEMDQAEAKTFRDLGHQEVKAPSQLGVAAPVALVSEDPRPSDPQLKRLFAISKASNVSQDQIKDYMLKEFNGKTSTKDLSLQEYDQICDAMKAGDLNQPIEEISDSQELPDQDSDLGMFPMPDDLRTHSPSHPFSRAETQQVKDAESLPKKSVELPWTKHLPKSNDPKLVK